MARKKQLSAKALTALAENITHERDRLAILRKLTDQLKTERALLLTVLQHLPCGVIIAGAPAGNLIMGNDLIERIWRLPLRSVAGVPDYRRWKAFHLNGRCYEPEDWPLLRAIRYGEDIRGEVFVIRRGDGTFAYVTSNAAPLRDPRGRIVAGMLAVMEIPEPAKGTRSQKPKKLVSLPIAQAA